MSSRGRGLLTIRFEDGVPPDVFAWGSRLGECGTPRLGRCGTLCLGGCGASDGISRENGQKMRSSRSEPWRETRDTTEEFLSWLSG